MSKPYILIIEDHKEFREAVVHFLELHHLGVRIIEAGSGEEGILLARNKKPQIVVVDFALGGIDGLEVARQIKKQVSRCSIIMLTIYDSKEILRRDKLGVIQVFINKGDLYEKLALTLKECLFKLGKNKKKTIKRADKAPKAPFRKE